MANNADTKPLTELQHFVNLLSLDDGIELLALFAAQQQRITELEAWLERIEQLARLHEREWIDKVNAQTSRVARQPLIHIQWGQLASIVADLLHADENGGEG